MRKLINLFTLFFISFGFGQQNQISESDLIGYWAYEKTINEKDFNITVYKRSNFAQKATLIRFKSDGKYIVNYYWGPRRCPNDGLPKSESGTFSYDSQLKIFRLKSKSISSRTRGDIVWFDENTIGIKKLKHNNTSYEKP